MYRVVLWGMKGTYNRFYNVVKFEELKGNIEVMGIVSRETYVGSIDGYKVFHRKEIKEIKWDYILVMAVDKNYV